MENILEPNENISIISSEVRALQVIICDDETEQIEKIRQVLDQIQPNISLCIDEFTSAAELLEVLQEHAEKDMPMPDIIFSDIKMPEVDGISFGKQLHQIAPECFLVFTTAYAEYAIEGYEARAFRYLLKPVSVEEVNKIIEDILLEMGKRYRLWIREKEEYLIPLNDVIYISAEDKYTIIYTPKGYYVTRLSLAEYEKKLECYGFCRVHRKYIVNTFHHLAMGNGRIEMSNGKCLPISRRRKDVYYEKVMMRLEKDLLR